MAVKLGKFRPVGRVIALFVGMGCELKRVSNPVLIDDGDAFYPRYLISPDRTSFVPIEDLHDDDSISESEVEYWERRLGIKIPGDNEIN